MWHLLLPYIHKEVQIFDQRKPVFHDFFLAGFIYGLYVLSRYSVGRKTFVYLNMFQLYENSFARKMFNLRSC